MWCAESNGANRLMTKCAAYLKAKIARVGIDEAGGDSAIATVPMNEAEVRFPHFPGLLHNLGQYSAPHYVTWMIPVQINVHLNQHSTMGSRIRTFFGI